LNGVEERARAFWQRTEQYQKLGHDRFAAAAFVAGVAGKLEGPVLDVGTGKGLMAMALARHGVDVVSVDLSPDDSELAAFLARKAGLAERISFLVKDARSLPFEDGHFGCAAMMEVLHHLDDGAPVLSEMARLVKPGGKIIIADFSEEGFAMVSAIHRAEGHEHPRSNATLDNAASHLASLGFREGGRAEAHHNVAAWFAKGPDSL
jgi:ubiquinone/menaquinone biosynthesis C-methylase UbiE